MQRPPQTRRASAVVVVLAALSFFAAPAAASTVGRSRASASRSRELAAEILSRSGYQTELPSSGAGESRGADGSGGPSRFGGRWSIPVPGGLGALLGILVWIGAAVVAVAALLAIVQAAAGWWRRSRTREGSEAGRAEPAGGRGAGPGVPVPTFEAAEGLAAAGRYGEAAHLLLLHALAALGEQRGRGFAKSATSREILGSRSLPPAARAPLRALVTAVERSLFAGVELGPEDWDGCRSAYAALEAGP